MIKICIIMQAIQTLGGVQRVVSTMMNSLANDPNYEVYIYTPFVDRDEELFPVNEKIVLIDAKKYQVPDNFFTKVVKKINRNTKVFMPFPRFIENVYFTEREVTGLCSYVQEKGVDVLVGASPMYSILAGIVTSKLPQVKAVAWMHSTYDSYFLYKDHPTYSMQKLFRMYCAYFEKIFVLTEADKKIYSSHLKEWRDKIVVFNNPVTIEISDKSLLKPQRLLFVGRINTDHKGCDLLFDIAKILKNKERKFTLDVVGEGEFLVEFKELVEKNDMKANVLFHGISNDVARYYKQASVLLVTSRYEGFGLVITEAMSFGIPVVAFHAQGPDEIITDQESGFLIPQYDCEQFANRLVELLDNPDLLSDMSNNALKRSELFSLDMAVEKFKGYMEGCFKQ